MMESRKFVFRRSTFAVLCCSVIMALSILLVFESPLRIGFAFFDVCLLAILYLGFTNETPPIREISIDYRSRTIVDLVLVMISLSQIVMLMLIGSGVFLLFTSIVTSLLIPGYVLLRIVGFKSSGSWLEWPVVSFAISVGITGALELFLLLIATNQQIVFSVTFHLLSYVPLSLDTKLRKPHGTEHLEKVAHVRINTVGASLLLWTGLFFLFSVSYMYPGMLSYLGLDISRHYALTALLCHDLELYSSFYPWFHLILVFPYSVAGTDFLTFTTGCTFISICIISSFYIAAKSYCRDENSLEPELATLFFSVFAGFGWLASFAFYTAQPRSIFLGFLNVTSYWDIGYAYGPWTWLWFRPMTVAFTMVFIFFYLLRRGDLPRGPYILILAILVATTGLIHVPELLLLCIIQVALVIFLPRSNDLRLCDSSVALLIGVIVFNVVSFALMGRIIEPISWTVFALLTVLSFFAAVLSSGIVSVGFPRSYSAIALRYSSLITIVLFLAGLVTWSLNPRVYSYTMTYAVQYVPIMMLPVLLGVVGFLALAGIYVFQCRSPMDDRLLALSIVFYAVLLFGELLSVLNALGLGFEYGARRFLPVAFAVACVLAARTIRTDLSVSRSKTWSAIIVTALILSGTLSTSFTLEYWAIRMPEPMSSSEVDAIEYMCFPSNRGFNTPILTASFTSWSRAQYIPSSYIYDRNRPPVWESKYAEIPLLLTETDIYSTTYLYTYSSESDYIEQNYGNGFFLNYFSSRLNHKYDNSEVQVLSIPSGTPPSHESEVVLVTDGPLNNTYFAALDILSMGNYSYTTCVKTDITTIAQGQTVVLPSDDDATMDLFGEVVSRWQSETEQKRVLIVNPSELGPISEYFIEETGMFHFEALLVRGVEEDIPLPFPIDVTSVSLYSDVEILTEYVGLAVETPMAFRKTINGTEVTYLNLSPILNSCFRQSRTVENSPSLALFLGSVSNNSIEDVTGNGNNASNHGGIVTFGHLGQCLRFDGTDDNVSIDDGPVFSTDDGLSVEAWIKPLSPRNGFMIADKKQSYASVDGFGFLYDGSSFYFNIGNGTHSFQNRFEFSSLSQGDWHQISSTFDGSQVSFYVDGEQIGTVHTNEKIQENALDLLVGAGRSNEWALDGFMYRFAFYNRALNSSDIKTSYESTMREAWSLDAISQIAGRILRAMGANMPTDVTYSTWVYQGNTIFFKNCSLTGEVSIGSTSFAGLETTLASDVGTTIDGVFNSYVNVSECTITDTDSLDIRSSNVQFLDGCGYYCNIIADAPLIRARGGNVSILFIAEGGTIHSIRSSDCTLAFNQAVQFSIRCPCPFRANGTASFETLYSLFSSYSSLQSTGHDVVIEGTMSGSIQASDVYTYVSDFSWTGQETRNPPPMSWNEVDAIIMMAPYATIISLVGAAVMWRKRKASK